MRRRAAAAPGAKSRIPAGSRRDGSRGSALMATVDSRQSTVDSSGAHRPAESSVRRSPPELSSGRWTAPTVDSGLSTVDCRLSTSSCPSDLVHGVPDLAILEEVHEHLGQLDGHLALGLLGGGPD